VIEIGHDMGALNAFLDGEIPAVTCEICQDEVSGIGHGLRLLDAAEAMQGCIHCSLNPGLVIRGGKLSE
jgi:hypothetical protein